MRKLIAILTGIACLGVLCGSAATAANDANAVQVKGSDTMVHLASAWAEKFMQQHPNVEVSVTGGGSGTGIAALLNGTADIANSSRAIKDSEMNSAKNKGFTPVEHIVGLDGIAVIVNPSNPVKCLSLYQIRKIVTG